MFRWMRALAAVAVVAVLAAPALPAAETQLSAVQFPDRSSVSLKLIPTQRVSSAEGEASVKYRDGQARVEIDYKRLPPAILFGGDVTSYVAWAVARDGRAENLGELIVRDSSGSAEYRTGLKEFALLVTAEPYPLVLSPSDLIIFTAAAPPAKKASSIPFTLASLRPGAKRANEQISGMAYASDQPVDLVQAQAVLLQAQDIGAETYNPDAVRDSKIALAQATNLFRANKTREGVDYARRSLALSSTAIRDTERKLADKASADAAAARAAQLQSAQQQAATAQAQALDAREQALLAREQLAKSQQQLADAQQQAASLQQQSAQAQQDAAAAQQRAESAGLSAEAAESARREADDARARAETLATQAQGARLEAERASAALQAQKSELESKVTQTEAQKSELESRVTQTEAENARLRRERDDLTGQLNGALSSVAQITQTARGVVVNLPDILFDTNKATLKPNAQIAMGKLAGIVSVFPNINLRVEGHTDSTGTDAINDRLSKERAQSVVSFLQSQGVAASRLTSEGYGSKIPVADNATVEGRAKNRRVEIILAEGVIKEARP
ncbi:MAG TPA: OmpA family protein [Thermoanaerobaculia bacterium]|jgi:outer membrane protein OmpA-like peptidoglycan-associated protein